MLIGSDYDYVNEFLFKPCGTAHPKYIDRRCILEQDHEDEHSSPFKGKNDGTIEWIDWKTQSD